MPGRHRVLLEIVACVLAAGVAASAQAPVDSSLAAYIAAIRAVDSHAHPMRPVPRGAPPDTEYDALPLDGLPPFPLPLRLRSDNPERVAAARAIYGVRGLDTGTAYRNELQAAVSSAHQAHGEQFAEWALDRAGIDVMMANRIALGPGLKPPRFRWVTFVDALMLPLDIRGEAARTPDTRPLYPREAALLHRYMRDLRVTALPGTLDAYVRTIVTPTLQRQRRDGAVAVKFEAAYLRPLDFDTPDPALAARVYARYAGGSGVPTATEYKALQDYLFRVISREAGRLGMSVQIHVTEGFGGFYAARGSSPFLLEPAFNDSTLRGTNFIMVHGGWPLVGQTEAMLSKPNVYADISAMVLYVEPSMIALTLRQWLGVWPEKVLFGTDAFDGGPGQSWDQEAWIGATTGRRALAQALTGMMRDGEITRRRAEQLARMVMRENASAAYHLGLR